MRIPAAAALTLVLALSACGGSNDGPTKATPTKTASQDTSTKDKAADELAAMTADRAAELSGTPAPQDLASFRCGRDSKGRWNAVAIVSNRTKKAQTYQITVHVGPAEGESSPARTQSVGRINAGGSVTVRLRKLPAQADDGPCQVQLLASGA